MSDAAALAVEDVVAGYGGAPVLDGVSIPATDVAEVREVRHSRNTMLRTTSRENLVMVVAVAGKLEVD